MLDTWQRLERIISWTGLSINAFAREIGLSRAENIYQIKRGNNGISKDLAEIITTKYTNISKAWLLIGEGDMFLDAKDQQKSAIPYYDIDVTNYSTIATDKLEPASYLGVEMFQGGDLAARTFSDAMNPEIPKGAVVVLQEIELGEIVLGKAYFVEANGFKGIRNIRSSADQSSLRMVPCNLEQYDQMEIRKEEIKRIHLVRGVIIDKSL